MTTLSGGAQTRLCMPPYRRLTDDYRCAQCRQPAEGFVWAPNRGTVMFYCAPHKGAVTESLWTLADPDYTDGGPLRLGWREYLRPLRWKLRFWRWPSSWRNARRIKTFERWTQPVRTVTRKEQV
jgi:hypothetical protein